jgi:Ca2+-binding EF-hand superfamily protein
VTRVTFGVLAVGLTTVGLCPAADPVPAAPKAVPVELAVLGGDKLARVEVRVAVDGVPVSAVWDETFAKLFAYFDRDGSGALDAKEAARLPAARALRLAMGNGFTPPVGAAPALAELDGDSDGKVSPAELAAFYRANGLGGIQIGVGRLPASAELAAALLKTLDTDGDGAVSEKEWKAAADSLKKLDKNDDELIGAGELVPPAVYPGAAGTALLTPPTAEPPTEVVAKLPLVLLPADAKDARWAAEIARRVPRFKAAELPAWRKQEPAARWAVNLSDKAGAPERLSVAAGAVRVDGWTAGGKLNEALAVARKELVAQLDGTAPPEGKGGRRFGGGLGWLTPVADRDGDGVLDRKELDAWLDLQAQVARGQVLVTVFDGGGLFELIDANHDGALSVRELRGAWDRLKAAGCVTGGAFDPKAVADVVLVAVSHGYPRTLALDARGGPAWFRAMDRNGDGDVSRREFTGPADVFDKLDLDKDGLLSAEEAGKADAKK